MCLTWNSREFHVKFTWKNSREFHVKRASNVNSHEKFSRELHVNFTWTSREFHVNFMWSTDIIFTWISCEFLVNFTQNSREIHMKLTWIFFFASKIPNRCFWQEVNSVFNLLVIYWLDFGWTVFTVSLLSARNKKRVS